jgi:hypothetical protein
MPPALAMFTAFEQSQRRYECTGELGPLAVGAELA